MKQMIEAELMFYDSGPETVDPAVAYLTKRGYEVEVMPWRDEDDEGELITSTVWIIVCCMSELSDHEFFDQMLDLSFRLDGEVVEAGYRGEVGIKEAVEAHNRKCKAKAIAAAQAAGQ